MAPLPPYSIGKIQCPDSGGAGEKARGAHLLMREMSKEFEACFKNYCVNYFKMFLNLNYDSCLTYRLIKQEFLTLQYKGIF